MCRSFEVDPWRDAEYDATGPLRALKVRNPITRTWVTLTPPPVVDEPGAPEALAASFGAYCEAGWSLGHLDPHEIAAPFGWQASKPGG